MVKRIYIDNFRCFVNLELHLENINLLMGPNGSGKTSVFTILETLHRLISEGEKINDLFKSESLTRWQPDAMLQKVELDVSGNGGTYRYSLEVEHLSHRQTARIRNESLFFDAQPLYRFNIETDETGASVGTGRLYNDNPTHPGIPLPFDWARSGLYMVQERHDNKRLTWFKTCMERLIIAGIDPHAMHAETREARTRPAWNFSDYADWLDHLADEHRREVGLLEGELRKIIDGFDIFRFQKAGEAKILKAEFVDKTMFRLDELSDGQRVMIALYTLLYSLHEGTLCVDEPENFLALPEIQPWLDTLFDRLAEFPAQVILISHHPRVVNYLAGHAGFWFSRPEKRHVRVQRVAEAEDTGISLAKLMELGWIYDE